MAKILIVDDEIHIKNLLEYNLKKAGHEVFSVANGRTALENMDNFQPELILTDLDMPEMSGYKLIEKMLSEQETRDIPIIIITCKSQHEDRQKGLKMGVKEYLVKPFDPNRLVKKIGEILKNEKDRKENTDHR